MHRALTRQLVDCWAEACGSSGGGTYPADAPRKRIDWLLRAPGTDWRTESAWVVPTSSSDHRAVVFDLRRVR